jgi:hypothetical protein
MNITNGITQDEIAALLASKDDEAGDHILWVSRDGVIHLDLLPDNLTPAGFATQYEDHILLRFETLPCGCGYVGSEGASDTEWVSRLFRAMLEHWAKGQEEYIDVF